MGHSATVIPDSVCSAVSWEAGAETGGGALSRAVFPTKRWKAKEWEPQGVFCLDLDKVEVVEVVQEEVKNDTREKLREKGFDLTPRKYTDKGGILCLPLDKNLNGDVQAKHPDWVPIACPNCGRKCWKMPEADKLQAAQGVSLLCTECAVKAGFLSPYQPNNAPHPEGNCCCFSVK